MSDLIRGAGGVGRTLGGTVSRFPRTRTPKTAADSLDSRSYASILDLLCEGEIQGLKDGAKSIFLNGTPLQNADGTYNFESFDWEMRTGTQNQTYVPGFDEVFTEIPVNTAVTKTLPIVKTVTRNTVDAVRVTISIPQLQNIDPSGDVRGTSVTLQIDTQTNGGQYTTRITDTITGRTSDLYQKDYRVTLTGPFPVNVRVSRVTNDSTDQKLVNAFSWTSYTEITYTKLAYPNSALVALRIDAEQFNAIPERSYLIRGQKVQIPSNATVDSSTGALIYSGVWNGNFAAATWTSDPSWCLWDLLISKRYGFGNYLDANSLDKWSFYAASVYCSALNTRPNGTTNNYHPTTGRHGLSDGLGNYEPRFSCNVNIQTADDAYKLISDMASVFRAMPYWSAGSQNSGALVLSQDSPANSTYIFTPSNVTGAGFNYSGSSQKTRTTVAIVKYFDNTIRDFAYEVVEDRTGIAKYGVLSKTVEAFACTSRGQAHRLGEWLLYSEQNESEVVSFSASVDAGVIVRPGQVITIHDPVRVPSNRYAGRISAATTSVITIDRDTSKNLVLQSEDFSTTWTALNLTVTKNAISSPFDTLTAEALKETAANGEHYVRQTVANLVPNVIYTFSLYIENLGGRNVQIRILDADRTANGYYAIFSPLAGTIVLSPVISGQGASVSATITRALNGWWRVTLSGIPHPSCTRYLIDIFSVSGTTGSFAGDTTKGMYLWGAQLERGAGATEYLPNATGTSPKLTVIQPDGTTEQRSVASVDGNVITVSSPFTTTPNVGSVWMFENDIITPTTWRVLTVREENGTEYAITALSHNASKYNYIERGEKLETKDYRALYGIPTAPTDLGATESLYTYQNEVRSKITLAWSAVTGGASYEVQWRRDQGNWTTDRVQAPLHEILNITPGVFEYRVYTLNSVELPSNNFGYLSFTAVGKIAPPGNVTGFAASIDPSIGVTLSWDPVPDLDIQGYEIWQGAAWGVGTELGLVSATTYKVGTIPVGTTVTWWIKALDTSGAYSVVARSASITVGTAAAPSVTGAFVGTDLELRWTDVTGGLATAYYDIRYNTPGLPLLGEVQVGTVQGNTFRVAGKWIGTRRFLIAAVDIGGNIGARGSFDATILEPTAPSVTQQVIDNNVLFRWTDATRTLPIVYYELRRGSLLSTAELIGTKQGLFTTVFETASGTYTYWLAGVDSAGNKGPATPVTAVVSQPPDYQLRMDFNSTFSGVNVTSSNVYISNATLTASVNTTETWTTHFTSRGWTTPNDQVIATPVAFPVYAMPSTATAFFEETMDYGSVVASSKITATLTYQLVAGAITVTPTLSYRRLTTDPWQNFAGVSSVFATDFRYIKVRYDFSSSGGEDILVATALNIKLDSKLINDFGSGTAATPINGTYSQAATTITVTTPSAHGLTVNAKVDLNFTTGTAVDGVYVIATVPSTTTFTVTSATSATTTGNVTVHDGGTVITFNVAFVDIQAISVTPSATTAVVAVYDFVDIPNPTIFKVLLFDTNGVRVGGNFSWSARGT